MSATNYFEISRKKYIVLDIASYAFGAEEVNTYAWKYIMSIVDFCLLLTLAHMTGVKHVCIKMCEIFWQS